MEKKKLHQGFEEIFCLIKDPMRFTLTFAPGAFFLFCCPTYIAYSTIPGNLILFFFTTSIYFVISLFIARYLFDIFLSCYI